MATNMDIQTSEEKMGTAQYEIPHIAARREVRSR
jgi:hypothetical protein